MLPGDPITLQNPTIVERLDYIRPRQGGLLVPEWEFPDLGRVVPRGTVLGRTFSPYTFEELEVFESSVRAHSLDSAAGRGHPRAAG